MPSLGHMCSKAEHTQQAAAVDKRLFMLLGASRQLPLWHQDLLLTCVQQAATLDHRGRLLHLGRGFKSSECPAGCYWQCGLHVRHSTWVGAHLGVFMLSMTSKEMEWPPKATRSTPNPV